MRTRLVVAAALLLAILPVFGVGASTSGPPVPETDFLTSLDPEPCTPEEGNAYEAEYMAAEGWSEADGFARYPGACQRLRFTFGPILVKPGQNDVLVQPVTIEKPMQDGYITRFDPDLVYAADGTVPPIEQIHLHHGTWLNLSDSYGTGPFFAAGEEKTIAPFPKGYGMPIKAADQWQLLYMIHSAVAEPQLVYITYDVDFIPQAAAEELGIRDVFPIWLDVRPSGYPVFNVQRGYGGDDGTCTWPAEECAAFDPFGTIIPGQGAPPDSPGEDWSFPAAGGKLGRIDSFQGGTLIGIGGHLHPGGLTNDIDLVRSGEAKRIYTGEAVYWDRSDPSQPGGPPTSWDFSMKVTGLPRWGVHVEPGDVLRSNATYDTTFQSTYENMGIAVALLAPDAPDGTPTAPGVDPFDPAVAHDASAGCDSGGITANPPTLCDKGIATHGHLAENDNFGGPQGTALDAGTGSPTSRVDIGAFLYVPGDLSMLSMGIPTASSGSRVKFTNWDAFADIYHSVTSCAYPCTGQTGTAFPLANGATSTGRAIDFDSGELGYGIPGITAAKNVIDWDLDLTGYEPGEVVTYYCRIHPSMRGAIEVTG
jgi:hypothetical protein